MPPRNGSQKQPSNRTASISRTARASYISDDEDDIKVIHKSDAKRPEPKQSQNESVAKLQAITGLSSTEAAELLKACNDDINMAINLHLGSDIIQTDEVTSKPSSSSASINRANKVNQDLEDPIRAPIPQKTEKLLDYDPYSLVKPNNKRSRSAFDNYRDLNDYDETIAPYNRSKKRTLEELFRRPIDILFSGTFDTAKQVGAKSNRWILLNLQNIELFECQCLNRDLWKDETVKEIIKANFIFLQINDDTPDGQKLKNYYKINDYPYVAIIDPRTGEKMKHWTKLDASVFCEVVTNFLSDHELPVAQESPSTKTNGISTDDELKNYKNLNLNNQINNNKKVKFNSEASKQILFDSSSSISNDDDEDDDVIIEETTTTSPLSQKTTATLAPKACLKSEDHKTNGTTKTNMNGKHSIEDRQPKTCDNKKAKDESEQIRKKKEVNVEISTPTKSMSSNGEPKIRRFETHSEGNDCCLRIMFPNGDRLDFYTNGNSMLKVLISHLNEEGYKSPAYELIERLMRPLTTQGDTTSSNQQSRNLFNSNMELTFKQLNLYPRVFLLLQES